MTPALLEWARPRLERVEAELAACFADVEPAPLREACQYPILTGGKRIRPLLALASCEAAGAPFAAAIDAAVAVELLHTYSLVHDDLPAMDDDDLRRGRPTTHKVYGEAVAILVGDALLTEAFARIAASPRLVSELAMAGGARGMVGGQYRDIENLARDLDALVLLHRLKTGALIRGAVRMGAIAGGATDLERVTAYGEAMGLAFQVADDLLDADQDAGDDGPPSFVRLNGREWTASEARRLATMAEQAVAGLPGAGPLLLLARFAVDRAH
ncbi:MAG: polyprenyl synthetase family protein [Deltaproteobacteria bacterium]|nr:polyprenyl synthetase family protein [Deltaproteobacteria bacterium]